MFLSRDDPFLNSPFKLRVAGVKREFEAISGDEMTLDGRLSELGET